MAVKLDMSKAYDLVEWRFIEVVMRRMGFSEIWIGWIMECISSVSFSVLINGEKHGYIVPSRGLRQGDPLSPFLFVLCAEALSAMLSYVENRKAIHGIRICRGAPSVNHLFFADDTLIFSKATDGETNSIWVILRDYGLASGQVINFDKSAVFFSVNTPSDLRQRICHKLGVRRDAALGNYLGLPADIGRSKNAVFAYVKDALVSRIEGWSESMLNQSGREVNLKSIALALPTHVMSCVKLASPTYHT